MTQIYGLHPGHTTASRKCKNACCYPSADTDSDHNLDTIQDDMNIEGSRKTLKNSYFRHCKD